MVGQAPRGSSRQGFCKQEYSECCSSLRPAWVNLHKESLASAQASPQLSTTDIYKMKGLKLSRIIASVVHRICLPDVLQCCKAWFMRYVLAKAPIGLLATAFRPSNLHSPKGPQLISSGTLPLTGWLTAS